MGMTLFVELFIVLAILKPFQDPCTIRDLWAQFQEQCISQVKAYTVILFFMLLNAGMEISWENVHHHHLLEEVGDSELILEFYSCKISLCYTCFFMTLFILFLIERLTFFIVMIARLLEFEFMCRYAILTKDIATQMSSTTKDML